jgi:SAM-dependent methyltransferase
MRPVDEFSLRTPAGGDPGGNPGETAAPPFEDITETTGIPVSAEGADMLSTRYEYAAEVAQGKRVLEVGCAAGQGFGLISRAARSLVGGDYSMALLQSARRHYGDRVPLVRLSVEALPFRDQSFDIVLFFEASYYVPDMDAGFDEIARVLASGGAAVFANANPERPDFIRSPHSFHYHSADEFRRDLEGRGFRVRLEGAFPVDDGRRGVAFRLVGSVLSLARRLLERLRLVPRTLRGRARLKRLVFGRLRGVPAELPEGFGQSAPREPLAPGPVRGYKVIYVTAVKPT